jgi:osmoprotectant transport system permease protein
MIAMIKRLRLIVFASFFLFACLAVVGMLGGIFFKPDVVIGAKNCTEQQLLSEMMAIYLEAHTPLKIKRKFHLEGTRICFDALKTGSIDLYCEYSGTALLDILQETDLKKDLLFLKKEFNRRFECECLDPLGIDNHYVLLMQESKAKQWGIKTISDLIKYRQSLFLKVGLDPEFMVRPEKNLLCRIYGLDGQNEVLMMDQALLYLSLSKNSVHAISASSTDGQILAFPLRILQDDLNCFPSYLVFPIARKKILNEYPELKPLLQRLQGFMTNHEMQKLNYRVEKKYENVYQVARDFLISKQLIGI